MEIRTQNGRIACLLKAAKNFVRTYNHDIEQLSKNRTDTAELKRQLIEVIWKLYTRRGFEQ